MHDLLSALEESSGRDLTDWAQAWLQSSGVNAFTPHIRCGADGRIREVVIEQQGEPLRPHRVAVGLYRLNAEGALIRYARAETDLHGRLTPINGLVGAERPDLVLANDDDLSYAKLRFDARSLATLRRHLGDLADPLARALGWTGLWDLTCDGAFAAEEFLDLVAGFAGRESEIGLLQTLHTWSREALLFFVDPERRQAAGARLADAAVAEIRLAEPGADRHQAWTRFLASIAARDADLTLLQGLLAETDNQELRWALLEALAAHGRTDDEELELEAAHDDSAAGHRCFARCRTARPTAAAKAEAWAAVTKSAILGNATTQAVAAAFHKPGQQHLIAPYANRYFKELTDLWAKLPIETAVPVVTHLFPVFQPDALALAEQWLTDHPHAAPALRRLVIEAHADLSRGGRGPR
ncbi:hypothetical protein GCM10025734_00770 [Kitasatospora paranensis]